MLGFNRVKGMSIQVMTISFIHILLFSKLCKNSFFFQFERQTDRETKRQRSSSIYWFTPRIPTKPRLRQEPRTSPVILTWVVETPCCLQQCAQQEAGLEVELEFEPQHSDMGHGCPK